MVERKQFKTRLCVPYQKGRCSRQNCTFAHGNAELRRFSGSYSRQDYSSSDLRGKLERRHFSPRRLSPARDARSRQNIHDYSPGRPLEKRSDRKRKRDKGIAGQSDVSGSLRFSDRIQDKVREGKLHSSGSKNSLEEQLKKVQLEISMLDEQKFQFGVCLDESVQEVDSLNSRIQELQAQLFKENEECKRVTSKIRKFIKAHSQNTRLQDELRRSQARLQRLGNQLDSDIARTGVNEEDLSIDIVSNAEDVGFPSIIRDNVEQNDASPHRKRLPAGRDAVEETKQARTRKRSRWNLAAESNDKDYEGSEAPNNGAQTTKSHNIEGRPKKGTSCSSGNHSLEKLKESRVGVPSTSMAAHVVDEEVEIELDDKIERTETAPSENENEVAFKVRSLPMLPPTLTTAGTNYSQYEGDDENVNVDGLGEEAAIAHMDIV
ncbi:zinc finger CCCH domain-containing protein 13 isoform X2 [Neltuma alba]|uniref:zinc finger CCCH domain-containing protein 13 isoform X2 n=1 Tax=Neltuma alba TaxID=207710 RepID=UPI0010A56D12|nr:zinc finger CCCH domain-containing protein 13 isoform X2 [Prosopis alba]